MCNSQYLIGLGRIKSTANSRQIIQKCDGVPVNQHQNLPKPVMNVSFYPDSPRWVLFGTLDSEDPKR